MKRTPARKGKTIEEAIAVRELIDQALTDYGLDMASEIMKYVSENGHSVSRPTVNRLLRVRGYVRTVSGHWRKRRKGETDE